MNEVDNEDQWVGRIVVNVYAAATFAKQVGLIGIGKGTVLASE